MLLIWSMASCAVPYETEGRKVVKVGVAFERETMTVGEYVVDEAMRR